MKILVVASDRTVAQALQKSPFGYSHSVETVTAPAVATHLESSPKVSSPKPRYLIVIDDTAPQIDGLGLCRQLRATGVRSPILLLSHSNNSYQGISAIEAGADDYVTLPCPDEDLNSRVALLLHRCSSEYTSDEASDYSREVAQEEVGQEEVGQGEIGQGEVGQGEIGQEDLNRDYQQTEIRLKQQLERERSLAEITDAIRKTLDLGQILHVAVDRVRHLLETDRVLVFRFKPDLQGVVEAESVGADWMKTLGMTIHDSCFNEEYVATYRQGRIRSISNLYSGNIHPCYVNMLENVQVLANLVVPIVQDDHLWGLLIAHHCRDQRDWKPESTQLLKQVANQLGIAIQQAELYQTTRRELIERRQIQNALQESEERFRSLSAFSPVGIYQADIAGSYTYTNAKWQEMTGLTLEESLGDQWEQAIHPDDKGRVLDAWRRFISGESDFLLEFRFLNQRFLRQDTGADTGVARGGGIAVDVAVEAPVLERWVLGQAIAMRSPDTAQAAQIQFAQTQSAQTQSAQPQAVQTQAHTNQAQPVGDIVGYVGVNEDITERKRAEQKIKEQAALIDIATDAIFVRDLAGRIVFWSRGATRLYGWSEPEAIGQIAHQLLKKRDPATLELAIKTTLDQGFWQGELTQSTKTGQDIVVASRWTLVRNAAKAPQSLLEVNTDITDKKRLEAQFYQAQRLESLGQLASGIAHDLGNILTPILGIAQLLRITLKDIDSSTHEQLDILEKSAKRGANMVKQILTFAKGSPENEALVDITILLEEVIAVVRQGISHTIEIHQHIFEDEDAERQQKRVSVSSTHLHQVFMNLCVNARDAMPEGGILTLRANNVVIDAAAASKNLNRSAGRYVVVSVADTGIGIAPEMRDRIFDPFFTTKSPDKGTGLGLATVIGIVQNAGGFLEVFSEVSKGTEIKVYFPVIDDLI
ncbi:MAG: PAS domain S-box protein [Phormidesmis sp.]